MNEFTQLGDRYDVGNVIGRGGMAEVYEGMDRRLNRRVAIKILRADLARDPIFQERFRREAQSAAGLNHPNIVAIYDNGEDTVFDGTNYITVPYIVMEHVDGQTLRQLLQRGPRLAPERSLEICAGILAALDYAHRHGIVHRDIKPANIMINNLGDAKVMDFGIARAMTDLSTSFTATSSVMGTAQYLSPEQARGENVDARSDIYATGCVLFELLTGQAPFSGESPVSIAYQHVNELPKAPSVIDPQISTTLDAIVLHALEKQQSNRYQTAGEMRADVERAMAGMPILVSMNAQTTVLPTTSQVSSDTQEFPALIAPAPAKRKVGKWIFGGAFTAIVIAGLVFAANTLFGTGPSKFTVPNLRGKTVAEATISLTNNSLLLGTQDAQNDDNVPAGQIIGQDPAAGELLDKNQKVNVVVSLGKQQVEVPDLVNLTSVEAATGQLTRSQLVLGKVVPKTSSRPEGTVLAQNPKPGQKIDIGSSVDITVSSGKVAIPDVVGQSLIQAQNILMDSGFKVNFIQSIDDTVAINTVLAQTPSAGTLSVKGYTVQLTISIHSTPTSSPTPSISDTPEPTPSDTPSP